MKKNLLIITSFLLTLGNIYAQQLGACGTEITEEQMEVFYNRDKSHLEHKGVKAIVYIPVTYHLVADDNGVGAFTMSSLVNLHCSLNEDYTDADVVFYIHDIVYHNDDYYYYMEDANAGNTMFQTENVENTCNIYLVEDAKSGTTSVCGYSYLASYGNIINRNGIVLAKSCSGLGSTTLTHEMGHYLNLPHTFYGWEGSDYNLNPINQNQWERVNGTNCTSRGDGFCDTPPDYISDRWTCFTSKSFTDPNGTSFSVDEKNFMSYSSDNCQQYFKPQQQAEVNAAAGTYRPNLLTLPTPSLAAVATPQLVFPPANATNLTTSNLLFSWDAVPGADYYLVQFTQTNFFNIWNEAVVTTNSLIMNELIGNKIYKWRVLAFTYGNICGSFTSDRTFNTFGANTAVAAQNVLCVGDENGSASVSSDLVGVNYVWSKFDQASSNFVEILTTSVNSINNLTPGYYSVEVTNNTGSKATAFFTIEDVQDITISISKSGNSLMPTVTGGLAPYSYTWSNGGTNPLNTNPNSSINTLYIIDANGCFKSADFDNSPINNPTAINELASTELLILYPNPLVGSTLNVKFISSIENETEFKLVSITGQEMTQQFQKIEIGENNFTVNLDGFAKGVYMLQFMHQNSLITRKVIL